MNENSPDSTRSEERQKQSVWRNLAFVAALITAIATVSVGIGAVVIQSVGPGDTSTTTSPSAVPGPSASTTLALPLATQVATTSVPATTARAGVPRYLVDLPHFLGENTDIGLVLINGARYAKSFRSYVYFHQQPDFAINRVLANTRPVAGLVPGRDPELPVMRSGTWVTAAR